MSLAPKIDEVRLSVIYADVNLASFTETWNTVSVHDHVLQTPGYNVVRRDRAFGSSHGGFCVYIIDSIPFDVLNQYHNE